MLNTKELKIAKLARTFTERVRKDFPESEEFEVRQAIAKALINALITEPMLDELLDDDLV